MGSTNATRVSVRDRRKAQAKRSSADGTRTLAEWWPHYENELRSRDCRPATVRQYGKVLVRLARFIGDDAPAANVTPETLEAWRDALIISFMCDTGVRASECVGLLLDNLNLPARQCFIHAEVTKGRCGRAVTFGFTTAKLLGRYLRQRERHPFAFVSRALGRAARVIDVQHSLRTRETHRANGGHHRRAPAPIAPHVGTRDEIQRRRHRNADVARRMDFSEHGCPLRALRASSAGCRGIPTAGLAS